MNWRNILNEARAQTEPFIAGALKHRREHPAVYAKAHALAADWHRATATRNKALAGVSRGKSRRVAKRHAWANRNAARWHRQWRRYYEWRAQGTAEAEACSGMMRDHDAPE